MNGQIFQSLAVTKSIIILVFCFAFSQEIMAQDGLEGKKISSNLFGLFFEDINYAADGGLYAELVQNRSFEYNPTERKEWHPLSYWEYLTPGFSYGQISVETTTPVHANNPHYLVLNAEHVGHEKDYVGQTGVGIKNLGFAGIVVRSGDQYNFSMFARQLSDEPITMSISIQGSKDEILNEQTITINSTEWKEYSATLISFQDSDSASLVLLATNNGRFAMDVISLFPEKTFKNRSNGLRADLAQLLADMKPAFIRFPGGCLVHGSGLANMYRWKNTIGPIEQRVEQKNLWGYHQTVGLGFYEYFQYCEDIGAKPLPVLPAAVSCQNSGGTWRIGGTGQRALPKEQMPDYIQEVFDLIEWANGSATSTWGAKRAEAGHPEPFNLEFLGIGNEDKITPEFKERFAMIYEAVKEKYPDITVIGTSGPFHSGDDFENGWKFADDLQVPMIDEHYYAQPDWYMANMERYDSYDRSSSKVYLGEYASWGNKLKNALVEAAYLTGIERNGDVVDMASYAPLLAKKDFTQWKTDMIFFDNVNVCPTPNYYVQKMFSANQGDMYYGNVISFNKSDTTLAASCVQETQSKDIILKMVNLDSRPKNMQVDLSAFGRINSKAEKVVLTGKSEDENTYDNPDNVVPISSEFKAGKQFEYTALPMSLTVIRIEIR